jgi:hypothetical protein
MRDFGEVQPRGVHSLWLIFPLTVEYVLGDMLQERLPIEILHCYMIKNF